MATSIAACSSVVVTTSSFSAAAAASLSSTIEAPSHLASFTGLRPNKQQASSSSAALSVSNGSRTHCMLVWKPYDNPKFETLSYLPALTDDQVAKQVDYITGLGLIPCLEFCNIGVVYRKHFHGSGYYDGRYWTMWKLPMFGCTDSSLVLNEINECKKAYPDNYIRVLGFSAKRQVQISGFLAHKPPNVSSYTPETTSSSFPRVPSATKYRGPASSPSILPTPPPR